MNDVIPNDEDFLWDILILQMKRIVILDYQEYDITGKLRKASLRSRGLDP